MKKSYAKSFLIAIFTLFVSISCDQQFDTPSRLTTNNLLKDKDFLSFMSSVEEARQKILFRQKDLVIFKVTNGVSKPDFDGSLKNASASLEKIRLWAQTKELAIENKNLIVQELGFKNSVEYDQIEQNIQKSRETVVAKYPELLTLPKEERKELFLKVVEQWGKLPTAKTAFRENVICTDCFMNNCNSCGTGQGKTEIWEPYGGSCEKLQQCKSNAKNKRNAAKNQAEALFIAELVLCGADALAAGGYVAGGSAILGPGSLLAGVATTLVVDIGCMSLAAYVYHNRTREIDADYQHMIWECESMFPC